MIVRKIALITITVFFVQVTQANHAVTYQLSPGRFGDNLLSYVHAKWISYRYKIPLLYKPFIYSDHLFLHIQEKRFEESKHLYKHHLTLSPAVQIDNTKHIPTLYTAPYFPESKYELRHGVSFSGGAWYHFFVDWKDERFIELLREHIRPLVPIHHFELPKERFTVALHMRKGGNYDDQATVNAFPLKFLTEQFFIDQLHYVYETLNKKSLYVYLFTDDHNPRIILERFEKEFSSFDIQFDCRKIDNHESSNVINDFFNMQQFDCLIHSESNYSFLASKLGDFLISIYPDSFYRSSKGIVYDNVNMYINKKHPKYKKISINI